MKKILFLVVFGFSATLFSCTADQENGNSGNTTELQQTEIGGSTGNVPVKPPPPTP